MTKFDFTVQVNESGALITLTRLEDQKDVQFKLANSALDREVLLRLMTEHMNSLTDDDQCSMFFPDSKVKATGREKEVKIPDLTQVKNLKFMDPLPKLPGTPHRLLMGKKGKFEEVTREFFVGELARRFGQRAADAWAKEYLDNETNNA